MKTCNRKNELADTVRKHVNIVENNCNITCRKKKKDNREIVETIVISPVEIKTNAMQPVYQM